MGLNKMIKIGNAIKEHRKKLKLTQAEMADKLHIPRSTYAHYENNTREPNAATVKEVSKIFGIAPFDLIYNEDELKNFKSELHKTLEKGEPILEEMEKCLEFFGMIGIPKKDLDECLDKMAVEDIIFIGSTIKTSSKIIYENLFNYLNIKNEEHDKQTKELQDALNEINNLKAEIKQLKNK